MDLVFIKKEEPVEYALITSNEDGVLVDDNPVNSLVSLVHPSTDEKSIELDCFELFYLPKITAYVNLIIFFKISKGHLHHCFQGRTYE